MNHNNTSLNNVPECRRMTTLIHDELEPRTKREGTGKKCIIRMFKKWKPQIPTGSGKEKRGAHTSSHACFSSFFFFLYLLSCTSLLAIPCGYPGFC